MFLFIKMKYWYKILTQTVKTRFYDIKNNTSNTLCMSTAIQKDLLRKMSTRQYFDIDIILYGQMLVRPVAQRLAQINVYNEGKWVTDIHIYMYITILKKY